MPEEKQEPLNWHTEQKKVNDLIPYEGNPRQMTEKQAKDLQASLEKFNLADIPAINTDNMIVSGHQRMKILQLLGRGDETIDVRVPNRKLTLEEVREYCVRANKNLGEWDYDLLADFDGDLLNIGFDQDEIDRIMGNSENSENLGYTIECPHCNEKIKTSNRVKNVEKFVDN